MGFATAVTGSPFTKMIVTRLYSAPVTASSAMAVKAYDIRV